MLRDLLAYLKILIELGRSLLKQFNPNKPKDLLIKLKKYKNFGPSKAISIQRYFIKCIYRDNSRTKDWRFLIWEKSSSLIMKNQWIKLN